ncbi:helix-turn-helix domain-containing protein [Levilactobacillus enshiensis]|uniref:helix-turn-helix domain-containing protein n=1 Tax=Levilactobacillus enshiensis TaxID=2590213 RepID=UPI00131C96AA|nr:helix-turn-helix domain-containing protein [Levilactobacillus enshiensis]
MRKYDEDEIERRMAVDPELAREYHQVKADLEIAMAVRRLRKRLGLSRRDFAQLVGQPVLLIAQIEEGTASATMAQLVDIASQTNHELTVKFV